MNKNTYYMEKLQIYSLNCRGLNTYEKRVKLFTWLNDINADVIFLQETHFIEKNQFIYDSRWHGKIFHCFSESQYSKGVSTLFRKGLPIEIINTHKSIDGRRLLVNIRYDDKDFSFVNIYAPNNATERTDFFKRVSTWTNQYTCNKENTILARDFNCLLDSDSNGDKSVHTLKNVIKGLDLLDVWRNMNTEPGFTWCDGEDVPKSRIDYIFISREFAYIPCNIITRIVPGKHSNNTRMSDHRCIKLTLNTCGNIRGPGYWKFNTSLLQNTDFVNAMNIHLDNLIIDNQDPHHRWEEMKASIKTFCINFSSNLSKTNKFKTKLRIRVSDITG